MYRTVTKALVCVGVVMVLAAVMGNEAWAQCTATTTSCAAPPCISRYYYYSGGSRCCRCLCTGSVLEDVAINGFGGRFCKSPTDTDCGVLGLTLYGTEDTGNPAGDTCTSKDDPTVLDPNCGLLVSAVYQNPGGQLNCHIDTPFVKPGTLTTSGRFEFCDKKGKCSATLTVDLAEGEIPPPQNPNWTFLRTLFVKFKAVRTFCPGGYADDGKCCTTDAREGSPPTTTCGADNFYGNGEPLTDLQLCTLPPSSECQVGAQTAYNCENDKNLTCGGLTGVNCPAPLH